MRGAIGFGMRCWAVVIVLLLAGACAAPEEDAGAGTGTGTGTYAALIPTAAGCRWECPNCASIDACRPCQLVCPRDLEPCGEGVCGAKSTCCNTSCGICAPEGARCSKDLCLGENYGCESDADCRVFVNTCDGCACHALGPRQLDPICTGSPVKCTRDPCRGHEAVCDLATGTCLLK